jgi:hypothetical protein
LAQPDGTAPEPRNPQDLNRYSYVANNPVRYTDPTGNKICGDDNDPSTCIAGPPVNPNATPAPPAPPPPGPNDPPPAGSGTDGGGGGGGHGHHGVTEYDAPILLPGSGSSVNGVSAVPTDRFDVCQIASCPSARGYGNPFYLGGLGTTTVGPIIPPKVGDWAYRIFSARGWGESWSPNNPNAMGLANYRSAEAVPAANYGQYMVTATVQDPSQIVVKPADPIPAEELPGGGTEWFTTQPKGALNEGGAEYYSQDPTTGEFRPGIPAEPLWFRAITDGDPAPSGGILGLDELDLFDPE